MKNLLKSSREGKGLKIREVAQLLKIDQALVSKFETGNRKPTKDQILKLAAILEINPDDLLVVWLKEKILSELGYDQLALQAIKLAEKEIKQALPEPIKTTIPKSLQPILEEVDLAKKELDSFGQLAVNEVLGALELEYIFDSNRVEGNTLTLKEVELIINQGLIINQKSNREHQEVINHKNALVYMKQQTAKSNPFNQQELLQLQQILLPHLNHSYNGLYRRLQVMVKGSKYNPPHPDLVQKQMADCFLWYEENKTSLHPIVLAGEMHLLLTKVQPFIEGNGKISRLVMNMILLLHGYAIANIKGDAKTRLAYHHSLEKAMIMGKKKSFLMLVAEAELETLQRCLKMLRP